MCSVGSCMMLPKENKSNFCCMYTLWGIVESLERLAQGATVN